MNSQAALMQGMIWKTAWIIPRVLARSRDKARVCIYRNTAYKVWETDTPHCKGPDSNQGTVHTAPSARSWVQQEGQQDTWKTALCKKTQKKPKQNQSPNENKTIHQVSLDQKAKGGRGMPGSNGCHYGHFLAWNYQHKEEQFCDVKSCFEESSDQLLPILLGAMQWQSSIFIRI